MDKHQHEEQMKQQKLVDTLTSCTDEVVISMLADLKEHGELFYLEALLTMLTGNRGDTLKKALAEFVSDIKVQAAVPILASYIESRSAAKDISRVVTACWQSRLDFSKHLNPFFQVLITNDYRTAFEAFTVIENNIEGLPAQTLSQYISLVKGGVGNADRDKQLLMLEMVSVLDRMRRAAE